MFRQFLKSSAHIAVTTAPFWRRTLTSNNEEVYIQRLTGGLKGITVVSLNRPKAKNAFSRSMISTFDQLLNEVEHDPRTHVVIIRSSSPGVFCLGADFKNIKKMTERELHELLSKLRGLLLNLEQLPMPVIAAIDGPALGGGLEMALACDIRTAAATAKIGLVETRRGIIPNAGGTQRLPRLLSTSVAKELIFTARILNGFEAKDVGIVNHAVPQNDTKDAAFQKALKIAKQILPNSSKGVRMCKIAIDKGVQVDLATGYSFEEVCYSQVKPTKEQS